MSLLSHRELCELIDMGVIENTDYSAVNAASIDIHLGDKFIWEAQPETNDEYFIDYRSRKPFVSATYFGNEYNIEPGEFVLAQSIEVFNLPNNISAEYKLKSSMARIGLEHLTAGWCDAGWNGSVLTMEFKNLLEHHAITVRTGDAIGQMVFFRHEPVSDEASYATRGRYNRDKMVKTIKA